MIKSVVIWMVLGLGNGAGGEEAGDVCGCREEGCWSYGMDG